MSRIALVTGGSRGIGLAIAKKLTREGIDLAINGIRSEKQVAGTLKELRDSGAKVLYFRGDISLKKDRETILAELENKYGRLNYLINNAGVAPRERQDILEASEESFEFVIKTNLQGPYFLSQAVAKWLISQKQKDPAFPAAIITISSVSATVASANRGEYCISKAGLSMMNKLFAVRLAGYDIPVYEVRPGVIKTDMTAAVKDKYDRMFAEGMALQKRWGTTDDVAKAVAALVRGDFPYSTGSVFMVDGGITVNRL